MDSNHRYTVLQTVALTNLATLGCLQYMGVPVRHCPPTLVETAAGWFASNCPTHRVATPTDVPRRTSGAGSATPSVCSKTVASRRTTKLTLGAYLQHWVAGLSTANLKPRTVEYYHEYVARHLASRE